MHETRSSRLHYGHQCIDTDALEHDLRRLARPWMEDFPSLRLACVLIYAGLMLTLAGLSMSASAAVGPVHSGSQPAPHGAVDCHFLPGATCAGVGASAFDSKFEPSCALAGTPVLRGAMPAPGRAASGFLAGVGLAVLLAAGLFIRQRRIVLEQRVRLDRGAAELAVARARVAELERSDALTGIANEARMLHYLDESWRACIERGVPISALQIDVDRFRSFNQGHGRALGDRALRALAQSLSRQVTAAGGLLARAGGTRFIAVLPGSTVDEAETVAESLREAVIALEFRRPEPETGFLTASIGASTLAPTPEVRSDELLAYIDRAAVEAGRLGGNRVVVERRHGACGRKPRAC